MTPVPPITPLLRGGSHVPSSAAPAKATAIAASIPVTAGTGPSAGKLALLAIGAFAIGAAAYWWITTPSMDDNGPAERTIDQGFNTIAVSMPRASEEPAATEQPVGPARPAARPAAEVRGEKEIQEGKFTTAVKNYLRAEISFDAKTFTVKAYCNFIRDQRNKNPLVPTERMHEIAAEQFQRIRGAEAAAFIASLQDHSTLDAEVARIQEQAREFEATLRARDAALAGPERFTGEIDAAWNSYFGAQKAFIRALAPLCKFMAGEKTALTRHEEDTLTWTLAHANYKYGRAELEALEKGFKKLATDNSAISTADLMSQARRLVGTELFITVLQTAVERADATFEAYATLDDERARIAGRNINPAIETVAADSELAHVLDPVADAAEKRAQLIMERQEKIAFLGALASLATLKAAHDTAPEDHRRIASI